MPESNSLINLGDLSKPATVLIKKISNAIGVLYEPKRIKSKAKAVAEADKIKALAQIEISDIERRAFERLIYQEGRKQENIESITAQAVQELLPEAEVEALEEDWLIHFFKNCESITDKEMQSLWAALLAREASKPGVISKRTINFITSMDKKDAELFTKLSQFVWLMGDALPLIFDEYHKIYNNEGVDFSALKHLDDIGLISFEPLGYKRINLDQHAQLYYFGAHVRIKFNKARDNELQTGKVVFTQAGKELFPVCGAKKNNKYYKYVIDNWSKQGYVLSETSPKE